MTTAKSRSFPVWETVEIGSVIWPVDRRSIIESVTSFPLSYKVSDRCRAALNRIAIPRMLMARETINLVKVEGWDIWPDDRTHEEIACADPAILCEYAAKMGLRQIPGEAIIKLICLDLDQPVGEWLYVGMKPVPGYGIFVIGNDVDGRHLGITNDRMVSLFAHWVFWAPPFSR